MKEILKNKKLVIALVIAIITIIGIVSFIIVNKNNENDDERKFDEEKLKSNFSTFQSELDSYLSSLDTTKYNPELICADSNDIICGTVKIDNGTIFNMIPSLAKSTYKDLVRIANGKLEVKSLTEEEINYLNTFIQSAKYDYEYCINEYKEINGLNKSNVVTTVKTPEDLARE